MVVTLADKHNQEKFLCREALNIEYIKIAETVLICHCIS